MYWGHRSNESIGVLRDIWTRRSTLVFPATVWHDFAFGDRHKYHSEHLSPANDLRWQVTRFFSNFIAPDTRTGGSSSSSSKATDTKGSSTITKGNGILIASSSSESSCESNTISSASASASASSCSSSSKPNGSNGSCITSTTDPNKLVVVTNDQRNSVLFESMCLDTRELEYEPVQTSTLFCRFMLYAHYDDLCAWMRQFPVLFRKLLSRALRYWLKNDNTRTVVLADRHWCLQANPNSLLTIVFFFFLILKNRWGGWRLFVLSGHIIFPTLPGLELPSFCTCSKLVSADKCLGFLPC